MKYCIMGNPGAGSVPSVSLRQTDIEFPIRFKYFEADNDIKAYSYGVALSMNRNDDGCYVFACDDNWQITGQVEAEEKKSIRR